ncbi:hypothetical protein TKK_0017279 [Trichogramma kaykai]
MLPESEVPNANSTVISNKNPPRRVSETNNQRNSESYDSLDNTIAQLSKTLEQNRAPKRNFSEYKLTSKSNFTLWLDLLNSERESFSLKYLIDNKCEEESEVHRKNKANARNLIISRLDEIYHKRIIDIKDPFDIMNKIRETKRNESNLSESDLRLKLFSIVKKRHESVQEFSDRFDAIVREFETCNYKDTLQPKELDAAFYKAVMDMSPEVRTAALIHKGWNKHLTMEQIKSYMLQLEAEKGEIQNARAHQATSNYRRDDHWQQDRQRAEYNRQTEHQRIHQREYRRDYNRTDNRRPEAKTVEHCYRCNDREAGHWARDCPLVANNQWYCYVCNDVRNHKGDDCPNAVRRLEPSDNYNAYNRRNSNRGDSRDRNDLKIKIRVVIRNRASPYKKNGNPKNKPTEVADNLLSLRKFKELGYGIYLDNSTLEIFDRHTGECHLRGKYIPPNWIIELDLVTSSVENEQTCYAVTAQLLPPRATAS